MVMVEDPANSPTCAFGNFAGSLGGANADVLAGDGCTLAYIAGGVERVERNQIACPFSDTLGRCSSALAVPLPTSSAPLPTSPPGLRCWGWAVGWDVWAGCGGWGLSALAGGVLGTERTG